MGGVYVVEFMLILLVMLVPLFAAIEFFRLALCDQVLARATHNAARSAGRNPGNCRQAAENVFESDWASLWLFDRDDDGTLGFTSTGAPDGSSTGELSLQITADDGDISNGIDFRTSLCGNGGAWLRVVSTVPVRGSFGGDTVLLRAESWALNQR